MNHYYYLPLVLLLLAFTTTPKASTDLPDTLVIGKISHNPKKHYLYLKPMVKYAAAKMNDLGIKRVKVRMARTRGQLVRLVKSGRVDWVTETPFAASVLIKEAGAKPLLKKHKKQAAVYRSVIFARKDSNINQLKDLIGKKIAFEDPASTSAYYAPAKVLLDSGLKLARLNSIRESPPPGSIGFVFAGEEITISTWVEKGLVHAGAFSNQDWTKEDHLPKKYRQQFKIIKKSREYVRAVELIRSDLPKPISKRLKHILLEAENSNRGRQVMHAYQRTLRFSELSNSDIIEIKQLYKTGQQIDRILGL